MRAKRKPKRTATSSSTRAPQLEVVMSGAGAAASWLLKLGAVVGMLWAAFAVLNQGADAMEKGRENSARLEKLEERYNSHVEREWRLYQMDRGRARGAHAEDDEREPRGSSSDDKAEDTEQRDR